MATAFDPDDDGLFQQLIRVRSDPRNLDDTTNDRLMGRCHSLILQKQHWFCDQASRTVREAAIFLLKLHSYNNGAVDQWKERQIQVFHSCCNCLYVYQTEKMNSRST